ncbi:hypothetical protein OGAPHI_003453 [Ogataea philodendri]|uniref:Conserved oligomeric Golgi complex subunit 4 n=1 Tax=Ogataea philodendri TaxID=1378263 RepID=A0A9P8P6Z2_9ASCO|nr:uncharacterized protein OGAPHI_003453 [Ogataea philodendri]KAH3666457.1 hypothetical protein OGAPHI_003453 [Ogataea philodendri]
MSSRGLVLQNGSTGIDSLGPQTFSNGLEMSTRLVPSKETIRLELAKLEKSLQQATSLHQLLRLLNQIEAKQAQLDQILHTFTNKRHVAHSSSIRTLEISRVELSSTLNHSRSLKKIMDDASVLSSKITEKVRHLDSERSKTKATKEYVENVKTLKYEVQKIDTAIKQKNWLAAATSIGVIRSLPPGLIDDEFVEFIVPTSDLPEMPGDLVASWTVELNTIFVSEFNQAAANKDVQKLTYFFQLFPMIGKSEVGLECYSRFICNIISDQARAVLRSVQGKSDVRSSFYAQVLFQLYQTIADIVHQHSRIITRYYGSNVLTNILTAIQTECDLQSGLIFDTFWDTKKLDRALNDINNYGYPILVGSILNNLQGEEELKDDNLVIALADVSNLIDELSTMLNHWAMYCKFFVVSWNESIQSSSDHAVYPQPLLLSTFMEKIQKKATRSFDQLSTFAIRRTIEKAFLLENIPDLSPQLTLCIKYLTLTSRANATSNQSLLSLTPEDPPVSSIIEDITISLNLIMLQTMTTGEFLTIKNMISNTRRILENDFLNIMKKKLNDYQPRANSLLLTPHAIQALHSLNHRSALPMNPTGSSSNLISPRSGTPPLGGKDQNANASNLFMKSATSALNAAMNLSGVETETSDKLSQFIIVLNSISLFQKYLNKLSENMITKLEQDNLLIVDNQEFNQVHASMERDAKTDITMYVDLNNSEGTEENPSVRDRIKSVVKTLSTSFNDKSGLLLQEQIKILFNQNFRAKLARMINDALKESEYLISSDMMSLNAASESIIAFIKEWNSLIIPYLTTLTRENFQALIKLIVKNLAATMESKIWLMERKCNELGAAKLEKDISAIISEVTKYDYSFRDNFNRITQIVMMLGLDDDEELDDLDDLEWALTPTERNRARNLRIDRK